MKPRRPGVVTAAAIMAIIYAALMGAGSLCGLAGLAMQGAFPNNGDPFEEKLQEILDRDVPFQKAITIAMPLLSLVMALGMLAAGVGLLKMQPWARVLAIVICFIAMFATIGEAYYQCACVIPAVNRAIDEVLPLLLAQQGQQGPGAPPVQAMADIFRAIFIGLAIAYLVGYTLVVVYLFIIVMLLARNRMQLVYADAGRFDDDDRREERGRFDDDGRRGERRYPDHEDDDDWDRPPPPRDSRDEWRIR